VAAHTVHPGQLGGVLGTFEPALTRGMRRCSRACARPAASAQAIAEHFARHHWIEKCCIRACPLVPRTAAAGEADAGGFGGLLPSGCADGGGEAAQCDAAKVGCEARDVPGVET
jgi:hypothetical protein